MLFICYPKCTTCQKAKAYLDGSGVEYELRDIKENNPTYEELKSWFFASNLPVKRFFNTSGLLYKELELKDKLVGMSNDEALNLLATDGMLVKRPILIGYGTVMVGFIQDEWEPLIIHAKQVMAGKVRDAGIVTMTKGQYDVIARDLEWGATVLVDTSGFRKENEGAVLLADITKRNGQKLDKQFAPSDVWQSDVWQSDVWQSDVWRPPIVGESCYNNDRDDFNDSEVEVIFKSLGYIYRTAS